MGIQRIDELLSINGGVELNAPPSLATAVAQAGALFKAGTSSSRMVVDTASTKFVSLYTDCGATSGDSRGAYLRHYITGAGGGGETARIYTTVEDVIASTVHGAHISLSFGSTGKLTGLGVASRATLHIPNQAMSGGGHYAAVQAEVYSDGASSDPAGMITLAMLRVVNDGNASGKADVDDDAVLIEFDGFTAGSGHLLGDVGNEPTWTSKTRLIKCKIEGVGLTYLVAVDP